MCNESFNKIFINPRLEKSFNGLSKIDYSQDSNNLYMSDSILEKLIKNIYSDLNPMVIQFNWIDNLNCSINIDFYNKVFALQNSYFGKYNYINIIETSIFLINYDLINFFSENDVTLKISIKESFFENRNKKELELIEKNICLLKKYNIPFDVEINCEDCNVGFAEIIYSFLKKNKIYWSSLSSDASKGKNKIDVNKYGRFLCQIFDIWYADLEIEVPSNNIFISLFDSILYSYVHKVQTICQFKTYCGSEISINSDGDVYPCVYCDDKAKSIGSILSGSLLLMLNSNKMKEFRQRNLDISYDCKLCKWKSLCNGGCPKTRIKNSCDKEKTYLCEGYKLFFAYTNDRFAKLAKLLQV